MREERGNGSLFLSRCQCSALEMRWLRDDRSSATVSSLCQPTSHLSSCLPFQVFLHEATVRLMAGASPTRTHQLLEHSLRRRTPQSSKQGQSWGPGSDPLPMGLGGSSPWARCGGTDTTSSVFCCVRILSSHQPVAQTMLLPCSLQAS